MAKLKLKASTLLETIVSLVIIMISFGIMISFYTGIEKNNDWKYKSNIINIVKKLSSDTKISKDYYNKTIKYKNYLILQNFTSYNTNLIKIEYIVTNENNVKVFELNEIVPISY